MMARRNSLEMCLYSPVGQRLYLTKVERQRFLQAAQNLTTEYQLLFQTLAWSGCRISEALALRASSFDAEAKVVVVENLKKRKPGTFRAVPLPDQIFETVVASVNIRNGDQRLFPIHRSTAHRHLKRVMTKAKVLGPHASAKGLRHGFGVGAVQAGVPLNLVQKWLGHASIKTTAIYADAIGAEEREIAVKMWA